MTASVSALTDARLLRRLHLLSAVSGTLARGEPATAHSAWDELARLRGDPAALRAAREVRAASERAGLGRPQFMATGPWSSPSVVRRVWGGVRATDADSDD